MKTKSPASVGDPEGEAESDRDTDKVKGANAFCDLNRCKEDIVSDILEFAHRDDFREWLTDHCLSKEGVWLLFGKAGGPKTIKAAEALEEALCFGWIDGQMEKIDDKTYKKYFSLRRDNSKWSEKNKALVKSLEEQIAALFALLEGHGLAYTNFQAMSPSVKKTYTRAYLDAKTDAGREKRIAWMVDRLNRNLKPM